MKRTSQIFVFGFLSWSIIGALFRLFVMTTQHQPYDAVPVVTLGLACTGFFILITDRKAPPHE